MDELLERGRFLWGGRWEKDNGQVDCLGLAIEARRRIDPDLPSLGDYGWVYTRYNRDSFRPDILRECANAHTQVQMPSAGDVALLKGSRGIALGVFVGAYKNIADGVLLFGPGERPIIEPDYMLPNLIGYWRVKE